MAEDKSREDSETVVFEATVYDLDTVKKAAYRYIDKFSPDIRLSAEGQIVCNLKFASVAPV